MEKKTLKLNIKEKKRLDVAIRDLTALSRSQVQSLIENGHVQVNGRYIDTPGFKVKEGDRIEYLEIFPKQVELKSQDIPLEILYEDEFIIAINKQPGLVVHPSPGHDDGTLVNALVGTYIKEKDFNVGGHRIGIVHRLDRDTSGVMVVARNNEAYLKMQDLFRKKETTKIYGCLVHGRVETNGMINTMIARDERDRKKYSAKTAFGKEAQTLFEPERIYNSCTLLKVRILTGRTHQIRVHMNYMGNDVVGDRIYGNAGRDIGLLHELGYGGDSRDEILPRQMLHARELCFIHPFTGKKMEIKAPVPEDFSRVLKLLNKE